MASTDAATAIVIFGASGDLTNRKLVPALFNLFRKGRLPNNTRIIGFARRPYSTDDFRGLLREGAKQFANGTFNAATWDNFVKSISYVRGNLDTPEDYANLEKCLEALEDGSPANRLYYLATGPEYYGPVVESLNAAAMANQEHGWRRLVVEKPFGIDLDSAEALNKTIHSVFNENQVYRIDHYLGKETAQNILFFRFANTIFEPLWNHNYVAQVQISVAESISIEDRAGYYDKAGILRDMFQNHLLQLLALVAMEPPASFKADPLRNEKVKVLSSIPPIALSDSVRGQYQGYAALPKVAPGSQTATYAALKLHINNWRWQGVPFYLRSGKALTRKISQISIEFKRPPHLMFNLIDENEFTPNVLSLCIQPDEGMRLKFETKVPDSARRTRSVDMDFEYSSTFGAGTLPDAYERLLLDAVHGDAALFTRSDEIDVMWGLIDPILQGWDSPEAPPLAIYQSGSWGPPEADELLAREGHIWRHDCGE